MKAAYSCGKRGGIFLGGGGGEGGVDSGRVA